jgi:hypothetical protein
MTATRYPQTVNYSVLVEQQPDNTWVAIALGGLDCQVTASTREAALELLRQTIGQRLANGEIVQLEVEVLTSVHPWMELAGKYENDPMFAEMMAEIEWERREEDAQQSELMQPQWEGC